MSDHDDKGNYVPDSEEPQRPEELPAEPVASQETDEDGTTSTEIPAITPDQKKVNFEVTRPETSPLPEKDSQRPLDNHLLILRENYLNVGSSLERVDDDLRLYADAEAALLEEKEKSREPLLDSEGNLWYRALISSLDEAQVNGYGERAFEREASHWAQELTHEGTTLRPGIPRQDISRLGNNSREAMHLIRRRANTGVLFDVPLWHSGFWVRLRTPSLREVSQLQYDLSEAKVTIGTASRGMAFSNYQQTTMSLAVDFALQYVEEASVTGFKTGSDLKSRISVMDLYPLLWGLGVTMFPNGFPYAHPCVADPRHCQHITRELLSLQKLFRVDTNSISPEQAKLMARRFSKRATDEELEKYLDDFPIRDRVVWFGDTGIQLKVPNMQEFEDQGREWINNMINLTQGAFNEPPYGNNRNQYITTLAARTAARQFTHWVAKILIRDADNPDEEPLEFSSDSIVLESLDTVFSEDAYIAEFTEAVAQFQDDVTVSMVAITSFNCPECSTPVAEKFHERFPHLVPLDVLNQFFTLVNQRLNPPQT